MRGYEITERGKIFVALFLVLLILVVPSAILAYKAIADEPSSPSTGDSQGGSPAPPNANGSQPTEEPDAPPPNNGGDFNQTDSEASNGDIDHGESSIPTPATTSNESGSPSISPSAPPVSPSSSPASPSASPDGTPETLTPSESSESGDTGSPNGGNDLPDGSSVSAGSEDQSSAAPESSSENGQGGSGQKESWQYESEERGK